MNTLAFIPARSGSKGVKDKNIRNLNGIPLLAYSVHIAQLCFKQGIFSDVLVSTDSIHYLEKIKQTGYTNQYIRPKKLAQDESPTIDAIIHALNDYCSEKKYNSVVIERVKDYYRYERYTHVCLPENWLLKNWNEYILA